MGRFYMMGADTRAMGRFVDLVWVDSAGLALDK